VYLLRWGHKKNGHPIKSARLYQPCTKFQCGNSELPAHYFCVEQLIVSLRLLFRPPGVQRVAKS